MADTPGLISPRDVATRIYRAVSACGPFNAGDKFEAWPYGETFAMISGKGPVCSNSDLAEWMKAGQIEQIGGPPSRDPAAKK